MNAQTGFFGATYELPNAGTGVQLNSKGVGAYANAELCHVESNVGIGQAYFSPNVNTGIGKNCYKVLVKNVFMHLRHEPFKYLLNFL